MRLLVGIGCVGGAVIAGWGCRKDEARPLPPAASEAPSASAVASASTAPPKALPAYKAPLGLTWGQSPKEAKAILSKRLTFRTEGEYEKGLLVHGKPGDSTEQTYKGQFAGENVESIAVEFPHTDGLSMVIVNYPADDERPASKQWEILTEKMRAEYGEPVKIAAPPKTQAEALADAYPETGNKTKIVTLMGAASPGRYVELDAKIVKGEWAPMAVWGFSNAGVLVVVNDARDANGKHTLKPTWMFATKAALSDMSKSVPREF